MPIWSRSRWERDDQTVAVQELAARVASLEEEVRECRRQHLRLAELTDVVQELLVPIAQQDEEKVRRYLDRYSTALEPPAAPGQ